MKNYFFLLPACLFLISSALRAQPAGELENRCVLQLDKPFYVTGEVVWYHLSTPRYKGFDSVVVEVAVLDRNGRVMDQHFTRILAGETNGYVKIPYDWESGVYQFLFTATHLEASAVELASVPLPIYNDLSFTPDPELSDATAPARLLPRKKEPALIIDIKTDQPVYHPREKVKATIEVKDAGGRPVEARLSVAVVDAVLCGEPETDLPTIHYGKGFFGNPQLSRHRLLSGQLTDGAGQPVRTFYLAAFQPDSRQLYFSRSDASGRFYFELPDFYGQKPIQFIDYKRPDIKVKLIIREEQPEPMPLPFNETVGRYIRLSRQRKKINQVFQTLEMPLQPEFPPVDTRRYTPDRELRIADYERMEDLPTFFREISTPLKFRREGGRYIARMFNPGPRARRFYPNDPVFIVDGQLTRDADFIAHLDLQHIEQIDLFYDSENLRTHFGALGRSGIVRISSLTGSFQAPETEARNIFRLPGFQPPAEFPTPDPAGGQAPLFRPQLWWVPNIKTGEPGRADIEFRNSDSRSTFRITALARDADGNIGIGRAAYEVARRKD